MKKQIMIRAWEIRKQAAVNFNCNISEINFSFCLKQAWAEVQEEGNMIRKAIRKKYTGGKGIHFEIINVQVSEKTDHYFEEYNSLPIVDQVTGRDAFYQKAAGTDIPNRPCDAINGLNAQIWFI